MSASDQLVPVRAILVAPGGTDQGGIEMKQYKHSYFSVVVAMILSKARRECDATDDITAAVANWHISDQPAGPTGPANQNNPFKF